MTIYTKLEIGGVEYSPETMKVEKTMDNFDSTSNFTIDFINYAGRHKSDFSLNDEVVIYSDKDVNPSTTKIFTGIVENIKFRGSEKDERLTIRGRDYGAILQDIIISPRIFKNEEASKIAEGLLIQNAVNRGITWNNIDATGITIDRITFNNISLFDALRELAEISGFFFYIDVNKDLHFEQRDNVSSGLTFDNTNTTYADFTNTDNEIFNNIYVYGDRVLTGAREEFSSISPGSVYTLDDKPYNIRMIGSGATNTTLQPGGILYVSNPSDTDVKWLVNFQSSQVVIVSGTTGGNNLGWTGSVIIVEYDRSSPLISIRGDLTSQSTYGRKDKRVIDRNIKSLDEANLRANTLLAKYKDPLIQGDIDVNGVVNVTPGETCIVNIPFHDISNQTYMMLNASYSFTKQNNFSNNVLTLSVNKRIKDFTSYIKEVELRLRNLEGAEVDTSITNIELATGSVTVQDSYKAICRSIGSSFYFHVPGHNQLNSPTALLGDMRLGSIVKSG